MGLNLLQINKAVAAGLQTQIMLMQLLILGCEQVSMLCDSLIKSNIQPTYYAKVKTRNIDELERYKNKLKSDEQRLEHLNKIIHLQTNQLCEEQR